MPRATKVGGFENVFIEVAGSGLAGVKAAVAAVEKVGGRVTHALPPSVVVAAVPTGRSGELRGRPRLVSVTALRIPSTRMKGRPPVVVEAMRVWNQHLEPAWMGRALADPSLHESLDAPGRLPPDPPPDIAERLREKETKALGARAARALRSPAALGAPNVSVPVLVGRIGVGIVFVDSTVAEFAITDAEKLKVVSETVEGLNMLASFEPRAGIQWFYDVKRPKIGLPASKFPAGKEKTWEDVWRNAAMKSLGFAGSIAGMNSYLAGIKQAFSADHAFALFVTKYPKDWFAYQWANHVVMDFQVDGWGIDNFNRVLAHETGHVFGCPDEYASANCTCTATSGRYGVPNGNCESCAQPFVPCLMCANTPAVCDYTRGHLGWNELAVFSKGAATLKATFTFDLETGQVGGATGADLWWRHVTATERYLVPQGGAMVASLGRASFDAVSRQTLEAAPFTAAPLTGSPTAANQLKAGTVVAVKTGAGRLAKLVVDTYGKDLAVRWVTYK
jgi:hypothetical protein